MNQPNTPTHQNPPAISPELVEWAPTVSCPEPVERAQTQHADTPPAAPLSPSAHEEITNHKSDITNPTPDHDPNPSSPEHSEGSALSLSKGSAHDPNPFHRPGYTRFIYPNGYTEYVPHHPSHDRFPLDAFDGTLPQNQPDHPSQRTPNNVDDLLPPNHTQKPNATQKPAPSPDQALSSPMGFMKDCPEPACPELVERVEGLANPRPSTPNTPLQSVGLHPTSPTTAHPSSTHAHNTQPPAASLPPSAHEQIRNQKSDLTNPTPSVPLSASAVNPDTLPKVNFAQYNTKPTPPPPSIRTITLPSIKTLLLMPRGESYHRYPQAYPAQQTTLPRYYHEIETGTNTPRPEAPPDPAYLDRIRKLIATKNPNYTTTTNDIQNATASTSSFLLHPSSFLYNGHSASVIFQRNARRFSRDDWEHILELLTMRVRHLQKYYAPDYKLTFPPYYELIPNPCNPSLTHRITLPLDHPQNPNSATKPNDSTTSPSAHDPIRNPKSQIINPNPSVPLSASVVSPCPVTLLEMIRRIRNHLFPDYLKERKNSSGLCYSHIATANIAKYLTNDHPHNWQSPEFHELLLTFAENTRPPPTPRNTNLTTTKKRPDPKTPFSELDLHETLAQWYDRCGAPMFKNDMNDHAFAYHLHIKNLANDDPLSPLASIPYDTDAHSITFTLNEKNKVLHLTLNPEPVEGLQLHPDPESPQKEEPKNSNPTPKANDTLTDTPPQPKKTQTIPIPSSPQKPQTSQQILTSHPQTPPTHEPQIPNFHPTN